jgi:hypothetical protein
MLKGNHFLLIICLFGFLFGSCKKNTNSEKQQPCPGGCGIADFSLIDYQPAWSLDGEWIAYDNTDCGSSVTPAPPNSCGILIANNLEKKN